MAGKWCAGILVLFAAVASGAELARFDFTRAEDCRGWVAQHDVAGIEPGADGLVIRLNGSDPYFAGPAIDLPEGQMLWLRLRLKSEQGGMGQVFYYRQNPTEEASVRFHVPEGAWQEIRLPLPAMGRGYRLRIDPPGDGGTAILHSLSFAPRRAIAEPTWTKPQPPRIGNGALSVTSGALKITHSADELGGFTASLGGTPVAAGLNRGLIGYVIGDEPRWLDLKQSAKVDIRNEDGGVVVRAVAQDQDGATWTILHLIRAAPGDADGGAIDVFTRVRVDQERLAIYLPIFGLTAGPGWVGEKKKQAVFAGLEYLDENEPSSSEADIIGPGSKRQVPDSVKITFPLMAVLGADGRYIGLIWEPRPGISAVFDSPDRLFKSGGHVMGLIYPGADGANRIDGNLLPHWPQPLPAGQWLQVKATVIGGKGTSIVPAVQQYVALRGLPEVPDVGMDLQGYVKLAAAGWLDSKIREGDRYRHAWPGPFQPHAAADVAVWTDWLAGRCADEGLKQRLEQASRAALAQAPLGARNFAAVSHVRYPVVALLYGGVKENAAAAKAQAQSLLRRFEPDGRVLYRAGEMDYGKTHFAPDANGLTAQVVMALLEAASVSGDKQLIDEAIKRLRALDKFIDTVPRGAQTWEVPLHTPDILASANLVHAYVRGYELTGDSQLLEKARHWAWTGVPFVYLVNPTTKPIGPYATIAVLGATHWKAPNWMGLPVQWCGLVYADALYQLAAHDAQGPWTKLADGITASGIQQTWPIGKDPQRQGLLPDSLALRAQVRNDAAINPGTVQANAIRLMAKDVLYSFHAFRTAGLLVHAPGRLSEFNEQRGQIAFKVGGVMKQKYDVLVAGCTNAPRVKVNGTPAGADGYEYVKDGGWLVVHLTGDSTVEVAAD